MARSKPQPKAAKAKPKAAAPKPPSRAAIWEKFQRGVDKLAKELGVPQEFVLKKVREKGKPRGDAWADWERAYAEDCREAGFAQAFRVSRGDDYGVSNIDVEIPEVPACKVDTKYQVDGWSVFTMFMDNEEAYVQKGSADFFVMPLKGGQMSGNKGSVSVIRSEKLLELLAHVYLRENGKTGHPMSCPVCPGRIEAQATVAGVMAHCICRTCGLAVLVDEKKVPKTAWAGRESLLGGSAPTSAPEAAKRSHKSPRILPPPPEHSASAPKALRKRKTA